MGVPKGVPQKKGVGEGEGGDTYRHQCLVRWVIRKRINDRQGAFEWLEKWDQMHKGSRLRKDVYDQWKWGNRGEHPDWRDDPAVAAERKQLLEDVQGSNDHQQGGQGVQDSSSGAGGDAIHAEVRRVFNQTGN